MSPTNGWRNTGATPRRGTILLAERPRYNLTSMRGPARIVDGQLWIMESGAAGDRWLCTRQSFDWTPARKDDVVEVTFDLIADTLPGGGTPAVRIGYLIAAGDFHDQRDRTGGNILIDGNPGGSTAVHLDYPGADARSVGEIGAAGYRSGRNYGLRITNLGDDKFRLEHLVDGMVDGKNMTLSSADLPDGAFAWEYCCDRSFVIDNLRIELLPGALRRRLNRTSSSVNSRQCGRRPTALFRNATR